MKPDLCVINYNGARYLPDTLGALRTRAAEFGDVVLVDDASTDDSVEVAQREWPALRIVRRSRNGGPGASRNSGADALGGRRILFVDNDVVPEPPCAGLLGEALDANPAAVIAMPRVVYADEPGRIQFEGAEAHISGLQTIRLGERETAELPGSGSAEDSPAFVTSLVSACFLLDRDRWGPVPLFDERFKMYLEDHEFGLRANLRGLKIVVVPEAVCLHGEGTPGISMRETGHETPIRIRNIMLNRWQVILKLYDMRTLVLLAPSLLTFELFQLAGAVAMGRLGHWLDAVQDLAGLGPDLHRRRREFQRRRRVPDGAVLRGGPHPFNPSLAGRAPVRLLKGILDVVAEANWAAVRGVLAQEREAGKLPGPHSER